MPAVNFSALARRDVMQEMQSQDDNAWTILAITGSWCFLACIVVVMRVYTRVVMVQYLGWDDIAAVVAMIFGVVIWGCFIGESNWALGKHWSTITPEMLHHYSRWQFAHGMLMVWALLGMKIAFAIFLLRLSNGKVFRRTLFVVMFFMTVYTAASWLAIFLGCAPISANWNGRDGKCFSMSAYKGLGMTYSIIGMLTDAILALIPIPVISGMQLNLRTKVCLLLAFGMGLATVACGAAKTYHIYYYFEDPDRLYHDSYFVWGALELYVGIIAGCLVSLKPLIASFLDKAKSTLVTSAAIAKSLHHGAPRPTSLHRNSTKFDEKDEQRQQFNTFDTQNFPRIEICSVSDYEMPDVAIVEQPKVFRVELEVENIPTPLASNPVIELLPKSRRKHRPAPLNREAYSRKDILELPSMGGVLTSPSPTYLPSAIDLDFLDLIKGRDPETLQQHQQKEPSTVSRFSASTTSGMESPARTRDNTPRSSLCVPIICGLLTSPSPTFLPSPSNCDLDFFSLIRCRDPEVIAAANNSSSRRNTIISIPEEQGENCIVSLHATPAHARYQSMDFSELVMATTQTVHHMGAGEVRRRPSMAPSAKSTNSAFLCPPMHGADFRESQMFFHVMSSGQFRSTAEIAAKKLEVDEIPLSPMSLDSAQMSVLREQHGYVGFSPVFDGGFDDLASRERVDSSHAVLKKDE